MTAYDVVIALHIMAVVIAFGIPIAAPILVPYVRRAHPRAMPALHDAQHRINTHLTGPALVAIFLFGAWMAGDRDLWDQVWVQIPLLLTIAIAAGVGWTATTLRRLAELGRDDVAKAGSGEDVAWSRAYEALYGRYIAIEALVGGLVLVAIFVMAAKPG